MVYQLHSYRHWEAYLNRSDLKYGQFGENFTVDGLPDDEVCVGDRYRIGNALFEVTQPRVTCYRVGLRLNEPQMASLLVSHHRPGFYFRVIEEGEVGAGDEIVKVGEGTECVTIADIDSLLYLPGHPRKELERALRVPALSPGWKGSLKALIAQESGPAKTGNAGLGSSVGPPPAWLGFRPLRVTKIERESARVISFSFESTDGSMLPTAVAGQFLVLKLRTQPDGPPILRSYSLSGKPGADCYRVSVKLEVGGAASTFLHNEVRLGDVLEVSAPRGSFTLQPGDENVVLMSAGVGVTPVLAMLHSLSSTAAANPNRKVWWMYGTQNRDEHPFAQESRRLLESLQNGRAYITYSRPRSDDRLGEDYDAPGHLNVTAIEELGIPRDASIYLCGPPAFLKNLTDGLKLAGISASQIHTELFGPAASLTPGIVGVQGVPVHSPAGIIGTGPHVSFTRSGLTVPWDSRFQSLLELAEACDVPVKWSCRTGVCHTCECALIGGELEYSPEPLEPPAQGNALICCSQPASEIQIDL
jgi:ferredoxin-NADP reductase/MOSC domain-containing protein YiiM/ferredoxin